MKKRMRFGLGAALAMAMVGMGVSVAAAADSTTTPGFAGSFYLADSSDGYDFAPGAAIDQSHSVVAIPAPGDLTSTFPAPPADAQDVQTFIAPVGQENVKSAWLAYADNDLQTGGTYLINVSPMQQILPPGAAVTVLSTPGTYSIGWAYTKTTNLYIVDGGLHFAHITVVADGTWSYQTIAAAKTATTTALAVPATAPAENAAFNLSATVAPAAATGTVQFKDGAADLGLPVTLAAGAVTLPVTAGLAAGSHSITAVYSGDSAYAASTSAASVITIAGTPVGTTTTVAATSATGKALDPATITATAVAANSSTPTGTVTFTGSVDGGVVQNLGSAPVGAGGIASIGKANLTAGTWTFNASFAGTGLYTNSSSATAATLVLVAKVGVITDAQTVDVTIPDGSLSITTPYVGSKVFHLGTAVLNSATSTYSASGDFPDAADAPIKITDTRSGQPGFTAQVVSGDFVSGGASNQTFSGSHAGLTGLTKAVPVGGEIFNLGAVVLTDKAPVTPGLGSAETFAKYPALNPSGTVEIRGTLGIAGVPTSVLGGLYTATVTFTAF